MVYSQNTKKNKSKSQLSEHKKEDNHKEWSLKLPNKDTFLAELERLPVTEENMKGIFESDVLNYFRLINRTFHLNSDS